MYLTDLMAKIQTLWPDAFKTEAQIAAWTAEYKTALKNYEGPTLRAGWNRCIEQRSYANWPKPGEVAKYCKEVEPREEGRNVMAIGEIFEYVDGKNQDGRKAELVEEFLQLNYEAVATAKSEGWYEQMLVHLRRRANYLAQREYLIRESAARSFDGVPDLNPGEVVDDRAGLATLVLVPEKIAEFRQCVQSRRAAPGGRNKRLSKAMRKALHGDLPQDDPFSPEGAA